MQRKPGKGARYEVYTDPDLYRERPSRGGWARWLLIGMALLAIVAALGGPLYSVLHGSGAAAR